MSPAAETFSGTTWNTTSDVRTRYSELTTAALGDSAVTRTLEDTQNEIKSHLRPYWNVDDSTYWSSTNIVTYAPAVKAIHLKMVAGRCYREGVWGKGAMGADIAGAYGSQLEEEAWLALDRLIERGALGVSRRSDSPDSSRTVSFSSAGNVDPVFDYGDESGWERKPTGGGSRDVEPY